MRQSKYDFSEPSRWGTKPFKIRVYIYIVILLNGLHMTLSFDIFCLPFRDIARAEVEYSMK